MALIRGVKSLFPCPKCLVPKDFLSDLTLEYQLRTPAHTAEILDQVEILPTMVEKNELLKKFGLRPQPVIIYFFFKHIFHSILLEFLFYNCSFGSLFGMFF